MLTKTRPIGNISCLMSVQNSVKKFDTISKLAHNDKLNLNGHFSQFISYLGNLLDATHSLILSLPSIESQHSGRICQNKHVYYLSNKDRFIF